MKQRPEHLFDTDGALYDTRVKDWHKLPPLRAVYSYHAREIPSGIRGTALVRAALRAGGYAWPGGYALYFISNDGESLSFGAVRKNLASVLDSVMYGHRDDWRVVGIASTADTDEEMFCAHTGEEIA